MSKKRFLSIGVGLVCVLAVLAVGCAAATPAPAPAPAPTTAPKPAPAPTPTTAAPPLELTLSGAPPPSGSYAILVGVAQLVNRYSKNVRVLTVGLAGGNPGHLVRLSNNEAGLAYCDPFTSADAAAGVAQFKGKPITNARALISVKPSSVHVVVSEASGITKMEELTGKKFGSGPAANFYTSMVERVLQFLGIKPDFVEKSFDDLMVDLQNRRLPGLAKTSPWTGMDSMIQQIRATTPIRPLGFSNEQVAAAKKGLPYTWGPIVAGLYSPQQPELNCLVYTNYLYARADLPEEIAYQITKSISEHWADMVAITPEFKGLDPAKQTLEFATPGMLPFHPGTVRYLRERGLKVPDEYLPPEMKK